MKIRQVRADLFLVDSLMDMTKPTAALDTFTNGSKNAITYKDMYFEIQIMRPLKNDTWVKGIKHRMQEVGKLEVEYQIALDTANSNKPQTVAINERQIYIQIRQALNTGSVSRVLPHRVMDAARAATAIDFYGGLSKPQKQSTTLK